jgi:DNA-binding CsgD family transcriptional regulator/PAS domain-containing protein
MGENGGPGDAIVAAVEAIYGAAAQPSKWPDALQVVAGVFDDVGANLIWARVDGSFGALVSPGLASAARDYDKWQRLDIRARYITDKSMLARRDVVTDRHIATPQEIEEHPFYTQFLVPHGLGWIASANISPDPLIRVWISVQRAKAKAPYSDAELETLGRLARHAEQSLRLSVRLFDAELSKLGLADALARVGIGVFALDSLQRIVFSNPAADALLSDGLWTVNGCLSARAPRERRALDAMIEKMTQAALTEVDAPPTPLLIHRERSQRPLALYVLPIVAGGMDAATAQFLTSTRAIVLVIDPVAEAPADPALVRDLMGLTLGEARVAALVGAGLPPKSAAEKLGISESTARAVLKTVFAKTGVCRQSELAVLLTKLVLR